MENLSDFSGTGFDIIKWQDLALKNENLRQQFMQYFREGYYSQALALITNNVDIDSETVRPEVFNMINTSLTYLQNLYYNSVEVVLSEDEQQFQYMINNFISKKEFSATDIYIPYNFVVYNEQIYMCIKATTAGILPTNTDYWLLIGLKGEIGATAIDTTLRYKWDYKITYSPKNVVTYNNVLYVAKNRNNNSQPDINPEDWEVFMTIPRAKIIVSATEPNPDALVEGGQWWQVNKVYPNKTVTVSDVNNISLTVNDSETAPIESVEAYGNIEQFSTTGAQLLDIPSLSTKNYLGVIFTPKPDGTVIATGTSTGASYIDLRSLEPLPLGNYYISGCPVGGGSNRYQIMVYTLKDGSFTVLGADNGNGFSFTVSDDNAIVIRIILRAGTSGPLTFKPMLHAGSTPKPWEPYTGGKPSPNPEFPQDIKGVGWTPNLLSFKEWHDIIVLNSSKGVTRGTAIWDFSLRYITLTATEEDCYTTFDANDKVYKIPVKPNKGYILTWDAIGDIGKVYIFRNGLSASSVSIDNTIGVLRMTTNADTEFITFRLGVTNAGESCTYTNLMFMEDNNFITEYVDYAEKGKGVMEVTTSGLNLFDASKIPTKSESGVTVTNNGDGSFTITGSGTVTASFGGYYVYSRENAIKFIEYIEKNLGTYSMTNGDVFPYFYWKIGYSTTSVFEINTNTNYTRKISKEIINTFKSNENLKIIIGYHLSNGATIVPGTIKPMLWKNDTPPTVNDWVQFSGIPTCAKAMLSSQLYKIGDYARDYFHYNNGQWEVVHNIKKVVLDGSIEYSTYNIMTNSKEIRPVGSEYYSMVIPPQIQGAYTDKFRWVQTTWGKDTVGLFSNYSGNETNYKFLSFRIPVDADPNEYMDAHPTTVIFIPYNNGVNYSVNESIENSNEGNESAIELSQLSSFLPSTQMNVSSYISPTEIGLTYSADVDTYIKNNYS
ncbi:hypothetical protein CB457P1_00041 [Enterocloster phage CB457P1]|nr:hypothetical protein CB457P1_00041 [Enterocloster phage CB457P1]